MERCILVATDGGEASLAALRAGQDVARRLHLPLEVVSVCESGGAPAAVSAAGTSGATDDLLAGMQPGCRKRIAEQLRAAGVETPAAVHVRTGSPAATISRCAAERGARLIVVGRSGGSAMVDRMSGDETALRLLQAAHTPVLTVPDDFVGLPERVLVAVDFTSYSLDAAGAAAALLPRGGELHLLHAMADQSSVELRSHAEAQWLRAMRLEMEARLEAVAASLARDYPGVVVRAHLVDGRPVQSVLQLADELDVEMIAAGTNGYGFLGRLLLGSVAIQLVRRAGCATLIAPPRGVVPAPQRSPNGQRRHGWLDQGRPGGAKAAAR